MNLSTLNSVTTLYDRFERNKTKVRKISSSVLRRNNKMIDRIGRIVTLSYRNVFQLVDQYQCIYIFKMRQIIVLL